MEFRWNDWNLEHATRHGVDPEEAEDVVTHAKRPWPEERPDDKWLVWGHAKSGRMLQVVYLVDSEGTAYIIHARLLTPNEKRRYRKRARGS